MQLRVHISQGIIGSKKTVVPMKILLLNIVFCLIISANGYSQAITLVLKKVPLEKAFKEIKKQSGYNFVYTRDQISKSNSVSIRIKDASIKQVLDICFTNQPLTYIIDEKHVIVKDKAFKEVSSSSTNPVLNSQIDISGKVVNEKGEPVVGATVAIIGTNKATATDENGEFRLEIVDPGVTLVVTSIGYQPIKIKADGKNRYLIKMIQAISSLDETVIIAYGTTTKRLNTGSVSKVSKAEIERQPVSNPLSAIQGRMPGVFVNTENGMPGGNIKVQIRGRGSISAGTDPLYIIDGVPFISEPLNFAFSSLNTGIGGSTSPLNSINPNDIESLEVLKDADATAIYGSRAANGVVLITTKKSTGGKTKLDVNLNSGISSLVTFPKLLNLKQYLELRREGFINDGITPTVINAPDLIVWDTTKAINWPKYLLGGKALTTNAQVSVSGGNESTNFLLSGNYREEGTILPGDQKYERGGFNINLRHTASNKKLQIEFSSNFSTDKNKSLPSSIFSILTLPPNIPIFDKEGNYNWNGMADVNPGSVLLRKSMSITDNLLSNINLVYKIQPDLVFRTSFGYNKIQMDQVMTYPLLSLNPNYGSSSYAHYGNNKNNSLIVEPQIEYRKDFKYSFFNVLIGSSWQQSIREGAFLYGNNYSNDNLLEFQGAAGNLAASNLYFLYKYASLFGRIHFNYKQKYIVNISGRRDGSSRFGQDNQLGNFGSIGVAWVFNKESFLVNSEIISYGKIRASYGITGNDQIRDYQYLSTYRSSGNIYQGIIGLTPSRIANPNFGWESNQKLETALEVGMLKDRIIFTAAWYKNRSGNQLLDYPLPYISGPFGYFQANLPALIENKGWELQVNLNPISFEKTKLSFFGNISVPQNKLLKYPGLETSAFANTYVIGEDLSIRKAYHFLGVNIKTGLPEFEDVNHDGIINAPSDYKIIGKTSPYFYGGFGSDFSFGQFQLNIFFQFSKQYGQGLTTIPGPRNNKFDIAMERWQKPDDVTRIPKSIINSRPEYSKLSQSDFAFHNSSYVRLKNLSITYTILNKLFSNLSVSNAKIFVQGQNLFTWSRKISMYDPETIFVGIPPLKSITGGFQLTFK